MAIDVLIVDDEKNIRDILASVMVDEGYTARTASNSDEAIAEFNAKQPSVVILDVWLNNSELDGLGILSELKTINKDIPIIMISGHGTLDMAVSATKEGAYDFISKPFKTAELLSTMNRAMDTVKLKTQVDSLQDKLGIGDGEIIGNSKYVDDINAKIKKCAKSNISLICGDVGTGKEIIAQNIYKQSDNNGEISLFDCNSEKIKDFEKEIFGKKGVVGKSLKGVLIIDNVQSLDKKIQKQFVKYINDNETAKIIFISNDKDKIEKGLLALLGKSTIKTNPLNNRAEDIELLANEFILYKAKSRRQKSKKLDKSAITVLMKHNWVGNVWELLNVIDSLLINVESDIIVADDVKKCINNNNDDLNLGMEDILMLDLRKSRESFEKYYLTFHLKRFNGNITKTSDFVGMDRAALSRKIKTLNIIIDG